jgi:hypothetical protein
MLIWAACLKKPYLNSMSDLPLDGGEREPTTESENLRNTESRHE